MTRRPLAALPALLLGVAGLAQPPAPPPPPEYFVQLRYQIDARGLQHIELYREMKQYLDSLGFVRDPDEDVDDLEERDENHHTMRGFIKSADAPRLLGQRFIKTVVLTPKGQKLPEDAKEVRVELELPAGLSPEAQYRLSRQTARALADLGFREAVGYDTRDHSRLVGALPAGSVEALARADLRKLVYRRRTWWAPPPPAYLPPPRITEPLGPPFDNSSPVRLMIANPGLPAPASRLAPEPILPAQEKLGPGLRELLKDDAEKMKPRRLEVILALAPSDVDTSWPRHVRQASRGAAVEGRVGPIVTVYGPAAVVAGAANFEEVAAVRLPRPARDELATALVSSPAAARPLSLVPPARLAPFRPRSGPFRLAVVGTDFRGWEAALAAGLPAGTTLLDLTAERAPDLRPDPFPGDPKEEGSGTGYALAVAKANPGVALLLVRVAPEAPYMLLAAAKAINGEPYRSLSLDARLDELAAGRVALADRLEKVMALRRASFADFGAEPEPALEERVLTKAITDNLPLEETQKLPDYLKLPAPAQRRVLYRLAQHQYDRDLAEHHARSERALALVRDVRVFQGVRAVVSGLVWDEGYPLGGSGPFSRWFDDSPFCKALWFQALGDRRRQAWAGLFHDADGNGVMEFGPAATDLPACDWSTELNFLAWRPREGETTPVLPEGARLRLTLQWREAQDPDYLRVGDDPFRRPLADLRVTVFRQPHPEGKERPADDLIEVRPLAAGPALRIDKVANAGTYEYVVLLYVREPGRYAVRVEGRAPLGIRPPGAAELPALRRTAELRTRLFVQTLAGDGKAVLADFATAQAPGAPGDAQVVVPLP
jgi:hypothetical protein